MNGFYIRPVTRMIIHVHVLLLTTHNMMTCFAATKYAHNYYGLHFVKRSSSLAAKALTGLDRESAHPLQLHAVKRSCCTAANLGATGRLSPWVYMTWSCNGWADSLSNPVRAFCSELHWASPFFTSSIFC